MKLTDWIPGNVKPVRVGVYERLYDKDSIAPRIFYNYWNGEFWSVYGETPEDAAEDKSAATNKSPKSVALPVVAIVI